MSHSLRSQHQGPMVFPPFLPQLSVQCASPQYGTSPAEVREKFERIGEIKTFFDLSQNRGMVFITYVSPRRTAWTGRL